MQSYLDRDWGLQDRAALFVGRAFEKDDLGLTTVEVLTRAGMHVAMWDLEPPSNLEKFAQLGLDPFIEQVDVTQVEQVKGAYERLVQTFGPVDVLINNTKLKMEYIEGPHATRSKDPTPFWQADLARIRRTIDADLFGDILTTAVIVPDMVNRGRGSVINVLTASHTEHSGAHIPYGPSKAANRALTLAMAEQLQPTGVRVNGILPGASANRRGENDPSKPAYDWMARPILWLGSDASHAVTGQIFAGNAFSLPD